VVSVIDCPWLVCYFDAFIGEFFMRTFFGIAGALAWIAIVIAFAILLPMTNVGL